MLTLYTIGCPNCIALAEELHKSCLDYEVCKDVDKMIEMGMTTMPVLEADGVFMNYAQAQAWIKSQKGNDKANENK